MSDKKKLQVGIIGCGVICGNHISGILETEDAEITALCDIKLDRAKARAEEYDIHPDFYSNYVEMLDSESLDIIHICTPHHLHAEMAIAALSRNINVFLEKPMGISEEDIEKLLEAERQSNAKITVCFQNRFNDATIIANEIANGDGGVIEAFGSLFWQRGEKYYTESGWRGNYATEGGGVMINQAIHTIDLLCFFLGIPQKISATTANHHLKGIIEVEDSCGGRIVFESGSIANFYATTACTCFDTTTLFLKTKNHKIEIISPERLYVDGEAIDIKKSEKYIGKECYGNSHTRLILNFYDCIKNNTPPPVTLESAQYALKILLAAYASNGNETEINY